MKVRTVTHGRIKARYNAIPTAQERAFHIWLMDNFPCACGCGCTSEVVHHPLTRHPLQRWRRDHEYVVPMRSESHVALHGDEREEKCFADKAAQYRDAGIVEGMLNANS